MNIVIRLSLTRLIRLNPKVSFFFFRSHPIDFFLPDDDGASTCIISSVDISSSSTMTNQLRRPRQLFLSSWLYGNVIGGGKIIKKQERKIRTKQQQQQQRQQRQHRHGRRHLVPIVVNLCMMIVILPSVITWLYFLFNLTIPMTTTMTMTMTNDNQRVELVKTIMNQQQFQGGQQIPLRQEEEREQEQEQQEEIVTKQDHFKNMDEDFNDDDKEQNNKKDEKKFISAHPVYGKHIWLEWDGSSRTTNKENTKNQRRRQGQEKTNNNNRNHKTPQERQRQLIEVIYALPTFPKQSFEIFSSRPVPDKNDSDNDNDIDSNDTGNSSTTFVQPKGIILLLHACTHNALKFFAPHDVYCPTCIGLSEEMYITKTLLQNYSHEYVIIAITSSMTNGGGCWSNNDIPMVYHVLEEFQTKIIPKELSSSSSSLQSSSSVAVRENINIDYHTIAIGASSGGFMAARLLVENPQTVTIQNVLPTRMTTISIDAALVMVMGLQPALEQRLIDMANNNNNNNHKNNNINNDDVHNIKNNIQNHRHNDRKKSIYFAPMPKDKRTLKLTRHNYQQIMSNLTTTTTTTTMTRKISSSSSSSLSLPYLSIILDETSCVELPVTVDYLIQRVVGLSISLANHIISTLIQHQHIDSKTKLLIKDPTKSNWRDILVSSTTISSSSSSSSSSKRIMLSWAGGVSSSSTTNGKNGTASTIANAKKNTSQSTVLLEQHDLTPGISPLAKALHRAWAFHEHCSESIHPAMDFFLSHS